MRIRVSSVVAIIVFFMPAHGLAQLAQILPQALGEAVYMTSGGTSAGNPHQAHFEAAGVQDRVGLAMNKALVRQLGTFPIGSSSGGFVFNFDPASGLFNRASQSFGPGFAERALTNGQGRVGFGLNYQRLEFSKFEGIDLDNGDFVLVLQHNNCCAVAGNPLPDPADPFFEGDLVKMQMALKVKTDVFAPFVSVGLTNRWDAGAIVPITRVELAPTITATIDRIATGGNLAIHAFDSPDLTSQVIDDVSGSKTGLGDIVLRTKYRFVDVPGGGIAGDVDVRLPTGDKDNLLGTGALQTKLMLIASGEFGRVAPHVNFGYTFSKGELSELAALVPDDLVNTSVANAATVAQFNEGNTPGDLSVPDEFGYVVGVDVAAHPLVTISADMIGRTVRNSDRFAIDTRTYQYRTVNSGPLLNTTRQALTTTGTGNLNLVIGVVGAKVNIPGTPLLLTGSILFPLNDSGLRPNVTPVIGLDYSFKR
jgi:hypothetical protein